MITLLRKHFGLLAVVALAVGLVLSVGAVRAENLISNGGFESGNTSDWIAGDVDVVGPGTWAPSEGFYSLDLNGFFPGFISQDIATVPGAVYTVLFDLAGNPGFPQNVKKLEVSAAGDSAIYEFDTTGKSGATAETMGWREESFTFTATGTTTTLTFTSLHAPFTHPDRAQGAALDNIRVTAAVTDVAIDIKPGSFPNSINPRSRGVIPVAVLTTDTFDATTVDPTTVLFGATGTEAAPAHFAYEDVDGDGATDLILHFHTQQTGIQCGDTSATLTGETFGGQAIQGSDSIKTAGCK